MIKVKRPDKLPEVEAALAKPYPKFQNKTELERARDYYRTQPPPKKAYKFERYSDHAVCQALDELFHGKCAYCESSYRAVDARDVEHFRPKGGVTEAPNHPGYWWLAASWPNLLPSCPPCNQRRRQATYKPGMTPEEFEALSRREPATTSGKANAFPVLQQNWVADENGDLTAEEPLLINPCERDPGDHLEFVFDWKLPQYIWEADPVTAFAGPRFRNGAKDPYAEASIAVYGLWRSGLFRALNERVQEMQRVCIPVVDVMRDLMQDPPPANEAVLLGRLTNYRASLLAFTKPDKPYAAMARAFVAKFDAELDRFTDNEGI